MPIKLPSRKQLRGGKMENKHQPYDLAQMQSLSLRSKIRMTEERVKAWYEHWNGQVYVSISGGVDSQVLAHIVKNLYPDVPLVYVKTGLEYSSVDELGTNMADKILRPEKDFLTIIKEYGYPLISKEVAQSVHEVQYAIERGKEPPKYRMDKFKGLKKNADGTKSQFNMQKYEFLLEAPFRISHQCCIYMKKNPSKHYEKETGYKPFLGTMADESRLRRQKWLKVGCNAFEDNRPISAPLSFWTKQDILLYLKERNIDIASIYGNIAYVDSDGMEYDNNLFNSSMVLTTTGVKRTGCVFCGFSINNEKDKFLKLKEQEPAMYDYVMRGGKFDESGMWIPHNGLGYKFVIDWLNEHGNLGILY